MYATLAQLADAKLARELAQVATADNAAVIDDALMEASLRGGDLSAWPADQIALADDALGSRWITRYLLHKDRVNTAEATDPVVRDYKEALKFLQLTADGKFSLGADDPLPPPGAGAPEVCAPERVFTLDTLQDFGA